MFADLFFFFTRQT